MNPETAGTACSKSSPFGKGGLRGISSDVRPLDPLWVASANRRSEEIPPGPPFFKGGEPRIST
jgi:hypothetical protein